MSRVLLVAHRFPPDDLGGVERHVETAARGLRDAGHDARVLCQREGGRGRDPVLREETHPDGTPVYRLVTGRRHIDRHLEGAPEARAVLDALLLRLEPDVVHVHHVLFLDPRVLDRARRLGATVVVTLHDYYFACPLLHLRHTDGTDCDGPRGGLECADACFAHEGSLAVQRWTLRAAYYRRLLESADLLVAPSAYVARQMEELTGLGPIRVLSHGLERPLAMPTAAANGRDRLVLACTGTIVGHKGLDVLVEALAAVGPGAGPVELRLAGAVGDHAYARALRVALESLPWVDARFLGPYEPPELDRILDGVDALVVPSVWAETFSLVAREALLRGVPVLASDRGAPSEAVHDGVNGLVVDTRTPTALASALLRLRRDPELLPALRAGALASVVPDVPQHVEALLELYAEAAARHAAAGPPPGAAARELDALEAAQTALGFAG